MRHRLDTCRVDRLQRVDQREYRVELAADVAGGVGVEVDAGETRKARHVVGGEAHRRFGAQKTASNQCGENSGLGYHSGHFKAVRAERSRTHAPRRRASTSFMFDSFKGYFSSDLA